MDKKQEVVLNFDKYVRSVPDFPKEGILFKDIVPVLKILTIVKSYRCHG